jgi:putative DNA primase/helicase
VTTAEIAKRYLARGWNICPTVPRTKRPSRKLAPYLSGEARMTPEECDAHWAANPEDGIAIITGLPSMLIVVDIDRRKGGDVEATLAGTPTGLVVQTGNGAHLYCRHPGVTPISCTSNTEMKGVDRKADGGYVVAPPSIHPDTGEPYVWLSEGEPGPTPEWLLRSPAPTFNENGDGREPWVADIWLHPELVEPGTQHETLTRLAWWLSGHTPEDIARAQLLAFAHQLPLSRPHQPWTPGDINGLLDSALHKRAAQPVAFETHLPPEIAAAATAAPSGTRQAITDIDNARRFKIEHGEGARYVYPWRRWHIYDDQRWRADDVGMATRLAHRVADTLLAEALAEGSKQYLKEALRVRDDHRLRGMLAQAQALLAALPEDFDRDPWLLNVANGTLDLRTGTLREHDRDDYLSKVAPVAYDPSAECPIFMQFLAGVFRGDAALIEFVQRAVGYTLTGDTRERVLFILHGEGRNGKSTLLEVLSAALGDYATRTPTKTLLAKRGDDAIPNDVAALKGMRLVTASETEEGKRLAEALIKDLTGGDTISARFMRAEWFTFKPEFKLWLATNHKPAIRDGDDALWDRIRLIPFKVRFFELNDPSAPVDAPQIDKALRERLLAELPGILRWAIEGCLAWQQSGLVAPEAIKVAIGEYREEADHVRTFIDEWCTLGDKLFADNNALYPVYTSWCASTREHAHPRVGFFKRLSRLGFHPAKERGQRGWRGLTLRGPATTTPFSKPNEGENI